jgi:hypothetical protein
MRDISAERVGLLVAVVAHKRHCTLGSHPRSSSSGATHVPHPEERPLGRVSKDAHIPIKPAQTLPAFSSLWGGGLSAEALAKEGGESG